MKSHTSVLANSSLRPVTLIRAASIVAALTCSIFADAAPPQLDPRNLGFNADALSAIDEVAEQAIRDGETPGVVVCVGRSDGIAFLKAYGQRQVEPSPEPMTIDTVFDMASLTKPIATATSVMYLVQNGMLSPSDKVAKHLPDFAQNGKEEITVEQLLIHTSGLIPDNSIKDYDDGPEEAWKRIFALAPVAEPGTKFQYSDVNYLVLGRLVEKLSGKPLDVFAREMTFQPLAMKDSGYLPSEELKARTAATEMEGDVWLKGRVHDPRSARLGGVAGHAGLFSTATDMATYATAMLHSFDAFRSGAPTLHSTDGAWDLTKSGQIKRDVLLAPMAAAEMTEPRNVPRGQRAYGWDVRTGFSSNRGESFSDRAFGHGGFTGTAMWIDPEVDLYVIWLSSRLHPDGKGTINPLAGKVGTIAANALLDRKTPSAQASNSALAISPVLTGIDVLQRDGFEQLKGRKVGLITNHTGVSRGGETTASLLAKADGVELVALFSPEHGFEGKLDESGIGDTRDPATGVKVFSLYGETRTPTAVMVADLDTFVFDIQDIGARFYTYPSTMTNAMKAAAEHGKRFVVLDRPNPINGVDVEGPVLDEGRESFVGFHPIAVRHGMTIGELATMFKTERQLDLDLQVVKMEGWRRQDYFDMTALRWINPSPNMRSLNEATLYPGVGLLETTNVSVGRGTDTPFEVLGAPWIDGIKLATHLNERRLPGVRFVPIRFTPNASKYANEECGGINIVVVDRAQFHPVITGLAVAVQLRHDNPQEWETKNFDRLLIDKAVYDAVVAGRELPEIESLFSAELEPFKKRRAAFLLYE